MMSAHSGTRTIDRYISRCMNKFKTYISDMFTQENEAAWQYDDIFIVHCKKAKVSMHR